MRLQKVEKGQRLKYRLVLGAIGVVTGRAPDVIRVMMYRPEFFGRTVEVREELVDVEGVGIDGSRRKIPHLHVFGHALGQWR